MMQHKTYRLTLILLTLCTMVQAAVAEDFETLRAFMQSNLADERVVGCSAQVTMDGETIFLEAFGELDPAGTRELRTDDIMRIYSMTKAITSAAAVKLMEDGRLGIDDPVSMYIPEFADATVATWPEGTERTIETMQEVPARRPITVRDLILHTSGLAYNFSVEEALQKAYSDPWMEHTTLESAIRGVAGLPLAVQPGTQFLYGVNTDVLGRVVEVASGMPFEEYLRIEFFEPLGMKDTSFNPGPAERSMPIVRKSETTGRFAIDPTRIPGYDTAAGVHLPLGGQGLYSTLNDYTRFCRMILEGGSLDGTRVLDEESIVFMSRNHLGPDIESTIRFGLGFRVCEPVETSHGMFGHDRLAWGGAASTYFYIDPVNGVTAVFMTQLVPFNGPMNEAFHQAVLDDIAGMAAVTNN